MDEQRLERIRAGDKVAWAEFVKRFQPWIVCILQRAYVPSRDWDDVSQEIWLRTYRGLQTSWCLEKSAQNKSMEKRLQAWMGAIATRCVCDYRRRQGRSHEVPLGDVLVPAPEPAALLVDHLDWLNDEESRALTLSLTLTNWSEVGKQLAVSQTRIYQIRASILKKLGGHGETGE